MPYGSSFGGGDFGDSAFRPFSSLIAGVNAGEQMQYNALRSQVARDAMEREQKKTAALEQYESGGDPRVLRGVDPIMSAQLEDHLNKQTPEALIGYEKAADFIKKTRSIITPENWGVYKSSIEKQGWLQPDTLPSEVTPESLQKLLYMPELVQAYIKKAGVAPKVASFGGTVPGAKQPAQYDPATQSWKPIGPEILPKPDKPEKPLSRIAAEAEAKEKGKGKLNYVEFSKDYRIQYPDATTEQTWRAFRAKEGTPKAYSEEEKNVIATSKFLESVAVPIGDLGKRWAKAGPEEKGKMLAENVPLIRNTMFPAVSATPVKPAAIVPAMPDAAANKGKYMKDPKGKWFESNGTAWVPVE